MEKSNKTIYEHPSIITILFLIFLTLKLAGVGIVATWDWIWIFSPIWIPSALGILIFIIILLIK